MVVPTETATAFANGKKKRKIEAKQRLSVGLEYRWQMTRVADHAAS